MDPYTTVDEGALYEEARAGEITEATKAENADANYDEMNTALGFPPPEEEQITPPVEDKLPDLPSPEPVNYVAKVMDLTGKAAIGGLKTLQWVTRPIMSILEQGTAAIAHDYESEDFVGQLKEAFTVSGKVLMDGFFGAEWGEEIEDYGATIAERIAPNADPRVKGLLSGTLNLVTDPSVVVTMGGSQIIKESIKTAARTGKITGVSKGYKGVMQEGLQEVFTFGKGPDLIDQAKRRQAMEWAKTMDEGGPKKFEALEKLQALVEEDPIISESLLSVARKELKSESTRMKSILGDPNGPDFKLVTNPKIAPEDLLAKTFDSAKVDKYISVNLNHARMDTDEQLKSVLLNVGEKLKPMFLKAQGKGKLTDEKMMEMALGQTEQLGTLLGRKVSTMQPWDALALRIVNLSTTRKAMQLAEASLKSPTDTLLHKAYESAVAIQFATQLKTVKSASHGGNLLRAHAINIGEDAGFVRKVNQLIESTADRGGTKKDVILKELLASLNDPAKATRLIGKSHSADSLDVLLEVYKNSLLSGLITQSKNAVTNSAVALLRPTEQVFASMGAAGRLSVKDALIHNVEAIVMVDAVVHTTGDALRFASSKAVHKLTGGRYGGKATLNIPEDLAQSHEMAKQKLRPAVSSVALGKEGSLGAVVDFIGKGVRAPGTGLVGMDLFGKMMNNQMTINQMAARSAMTHTGSVKEAHRMYRILKDNPTETMIKQGRVDAEYFTFTNKLDPFFELGNKALRAFRPLQFLAPFYKSPINIGKMGVRYTPVGIAWTDRHLITKMNAAGDLARARMATSSLTSAYILHDMGENWTGYIDTSTEAGQLQAKLTPPFSFRMGEGESEQWWDYSFMGPLVPYFAFAASTNYFLKNIEIYDPDTYEINSMAEEAGGAMVGTIASILTENFFFPVIREISYMTGAVSNNNYELVGEKIEDIAASTLMPSLFSQLNNSVFDKNFRAAEGVIQKLMARTPGLSYLLPTKPNVWGDPRIRPSALGPDWISPFRRAGQEPDEIDLELERLNVSVPAAPETIKPIDGGPSIKLNLHEQERYSILRGKGRIDVMNQPLKFYIRDIFRMGFYRDLAAEDKRKLLENTFEDFGGVTEAQLFKNSTRLKMEYSKAVDRQNRIKMFYK